jgi:hypothetical protein
MGGIQIEHMLSLLDDKLTAKDRELMRTEVAVYINKNMDSVVSSLAEGGAAVIPTSNGNIRLTKADLELVAA